MKDNKIREQERQFELQLEKNKEMLALFEEELRTAGLKEKTIERHLDNVDFYVNHFLMRYGVLDMDQGIEMINSFLGDFYITHCMWSTPANMKTTAASIKKYYKCMVRNGFLPDDKYKELCRTIKDMMPFWQEDCEGYIVGESLYDFDFFDYDEEAEDDCDDMGKVIQFPGLKTDR